MPRNLFDEKETNCPVRHISPTYIRGLAKQKKGGRLIIFSLQIKIFMSNR